MRVTGTWATPRDIRIGGGRRSDEFLRLVRIALGLGWLGFQIYIIFFPQAPLFQRPLHLTLALAVLLLTKPLAGTHSKPSINRAVDLALLLAVVAVLLYYMLSAAA